MRLAVSAEMLKELNAWVLEDMVSPPVESPLRSDGKLIVDVTFRLFSRARAFALSHGNAVEVIHPPELRKSIADFAAQTLAVYDRGAGD